MITTRVFATPIGPLHLYATDRALVGAYFEGQRFTPPTMASSAAPSPILGRAADLLDRYFAGDIGAVLELPTAATGTELERAVWRALVAIPAGATRSYGGLAADLGRPRASRAIGRANGKNPLSIFVPCHRVIGADGSLTGYASGVDRKRWLLDHERKTCVIAVATSGSMPKMAASRA